MTAKEHYDADCFRMRFGDRCKILLDFDASRPNLPVVEVYTDQNGGVMPPQDARTLGEELIAWAQQYGGAS